MLVGRKKKKTLPFCPVRDQRNYSQEVRTERCCSSIKGRRRMSLSNMMHPPICRGVNVAKQTWCCRKESASSSCGEVFCFFVFMFVCLFIYFSPVCRKLVYGYRRINNKNIEQAGTPLSLVVAAYITYIFFFLYVKLMKCSESQIWVCEGEFIRLLHTRNLF